MRCSVFCFDIGYRFRKRRYQHLYQPERSAASGEMVMAVAVNPEHHWRHGKVACSTRRTSFLGIRILGSAIRTAALKPPAIYSPARIAASQPYAMG
jgi:hypothetical protein